MQWIHWKDSWDVKLAPALWKIDGIDIIAGVFLLFILTELLHLQAKFCALLLKVSVII